jgi:prevent-host-death family protein
MSIHQVSFQECNAQFANVFERVLENHEVISVCKESEQAVVILDAKEYSSLIETLYLLSDATNANRLREGIAQHQQGEVKDTMLRLTWTENALEDLNWWQQHDAKMLKRIIQLCLVAVKIQHTV